MCRYLLCVRQRTAYGIRDDGWGRDARCKLGARVGLSRGKVILIDGPFTEAKEVVGGYVVLKLRSKEEAIEGAMHFMELHKKHWPGWEGETEVRQMFGPEEFEQHVKELLSTQAK